MIKIRFRPVTSGVAEGEALVSHVPISFMIGIDPNTGTITEPGHELEGRSIAGKILTFPWAKGSATGAWQYYIAYKRSCAPKGIVNLRAEAAAVVSAIITDTPMLCEPELDVFQHIETGDFVRVNADDGYIEIQKCGERDFGD
jgi:predicted aconitase with swiveling domain